MIAAAVLLYLFFLIPPFLLFLFCIIDHILADFKKDSIFCDIPAKPTFYRFQTINIIFLNNKQVIIDIERIFLSKIRKIFMKNIILSCI